jgi:hypothetical protein
MTPPWGHYWREEMAGFHSPFYFDSSLLHSINTCLCQEVCAFFKQLPKCCQVRPCQHSNSSLMPPPFCIEIVMGFSWDDGGVIVVHVECTGVFILHRESCKRPCESCL